MSEAIEATVVPVEKWPRSALLRWALPLVIGPLFWYLLLTELGQVAGLIWLVGIAIYIPLVLFVAGKVSFNMSLPTRRMEGLRRFTLILGRIEMGLFPLMVYRALYVTLILGITFLGIEV